MSKIEKIFKSSLKNSEMPYDPKAWNDMSALLDKKMPVNAPKGNLKWFWAASIVAVVGVTSLILINNQTPSPEKSVVAVKNTVNTPDNSNEILETANTTTQKSTQELVTTSTSVPNESINPLKKNSPVSHTSVYTTEIIPQKGQSEKVNSNEINKTKPGAPEVKIIVPFFNAAYCTGEKINLKNSNDYTISLISESGKSFEILPLKNLQIKLNEAGSYYILYGNYKEYCFKVYSTPKADFIADNETYYEKGLPINNLKANVEAKNYLWTNSTGEILSRSKEFDVHLFTKGLHDISLQIEDINGCINQITKGVRCESTYNLLAVTGFNPSSADARNNTFIPFALLEAERNVGFEMQIIDPKTGQLVYQTSNADQPWDGVDIRTNQLVAPNSTFVWKVTIQKKATGEPKNLYQGTITRI